MTELSYTDMVAKIQDRQVSSLKNLKAAAVRFMETVAKEDAALVETGHLSPARSYIDRIKSVGSQYLENEIDALLAGYGVPTTQPAE